MTTAWKDERPKASSAKNIMSSTGMPRSTSMTEIATARTTRMPEVRRIASTKARTSARGAATTAALSVAPRPLTSSDLHTSSAFCPFGGSVRTAQRSSKMPRSAMPLTIQASRPSKITAKAIEPMRSRRRVVGPGAS